MQQMEGGAEGESDAHKDKCNHEALPLLLSSNDRRHFSYPVFTARASVCRQHAVVTFAPHAFTWRTAASNVSTLKESRMNKAAHRSNRAATSYTACTNEALSAHVKMETVSRNDALALPCASHA